MRRVGAARADDRGAALILAIGVIAIVALLGITALANANQEIEHAQRLVDRAESDGALDVALADAWAEILDGATAPVSGAGTTGDHGWSYTARPSADGLRWTIAIDADGPDGATTATADVAREALLPYSLRVRDVRTGPLTGNVADRVAILESAFFGGRDLGDQQELVDGATCNGCSDPIPVEHIADPPAPPVGLPVRPCPEVAGEITGDLAGDATFDCRGLGTLLITGAVTITGTVVIELGDDTVLTIDTADLNVGGDAAALFLSQPTTDRGAIDVIDSRLVGTVLAPEAPLTTAGLTWSGALVVDTLRTADGSELTGSRPATIETLGFDGWRVVRWTVDRGN